MQENQTAQDKRTIFALIEEEAAAITAGDLTRYLRLLGEEAVFMPPNSPEKTGQELRHWLGEFLENVAVEYHSFHHGETLVAGDAAWHVFTCSWTASPKSNPRAALLHFKGIHLLRRRPDGAWKIVREIWNLSPAQGS